MDIQRQNQIKQAEETIQKKMEQKKRLEPVELQNAYNKENLETQHKYNLEIFEKQAALNRELQDNQAKLLKNLSWRSVIATLTAGAIGTLLGIYLGRTEPNMPCQTQPQKTTITTEKQTTLALPSPGEKETAQAIKPTAPAESSSKTEQASSQPPKNKTNNP